MIEITKEIMPYWNVGLKLEDIANCYKSGRRLNSNCFIKFDVADSLVNVNLSDVRLIEGTLHVTINGLKNLPQNVVKVAVENGHLIVYYNEEEHEMAKVDLGQVVGAQGATGPQGPKGDNGITPTFSITDGHLFADYDNPYVPI